MSSQTSSQTSSQDTDPGWGYDDLGRPTTAVGDPHLSKLRDDYDNWLRERAAKQTGDAKKAQNKRKGRKGDSGPCGGTTWVGDVKIQNSNMEAPMPDGTTAKVVDAGRRLSRKKRAEGYVTPKDLQRMVAAGEVKELDVTLGGETFRIMLGRDSLSGSRQTRFDPSGLDIRTRGTATDGTPLGWRRAEGEDRAHVEQLLTLETLGNINPYGGANPSYVDTVVSAAILNWRTPAAAGGTVHPTQDSPEFRLRADAYLRVNLAAGLEPAQAAFLARERAQALSGGTSAPVDPALQERRAAQADDILESVHDIIDASRGLQRYQAPAQSGSQAPDDPNLPQQPRPTEVVVPIGRIGPDSTLVELTQHIPLSDDEYLAMPALAEYNRLAAEWKRCPNDEILKEARRLLAAAELDHPGATLRIASWADPLGGIDTSTLAGEIAHPTRPRPEQHEALRAERKALAREVAELSQPIRSAGGMYSPRVSWELPEEQERRLEQLEDAQQRLTLLDRHTELSREIERLSHPQVVQSMTVGFREDSREREERILSLGAAERARDALARELAGPSGSEAPAALRGLCARLAEQPSLLDREYEAGQLLQLVSLASADDMVGTGSSIDSISQTLSDLGAASDAMVARREAPEGAKLLAGTPDPASNRERLFSVIARIAGVDVPPPYGDAAHAKLASPQALRTELTLLAAHNLTGRND